MGQISNQETKWEGKVKAKVLGPKPDQAWFLLKDFCSLHRWVPSLDACHKLEGVEDQPGCVRYCVGSVNRADPGQPLGWSKERLLEFDPVGRSYTYEIVETNKGFGSYAATIRVGSDPEGCCIEWSFVSDPVEGWTQEGFVEYLEKLAHGVAKRLEEEITIVEINN